MQKYNIVAMIPARKGSERLKLKNLALLKGHPLISYAVRSAKKSEVFTRVVVNADSKKFEKVCNKYKCEFYLRRPKLGLSNVKSDDVVLDFLKNHKCDILMWINPIAPLLEESDILEVLKYFIKKKLNSLITTQQVNVHGLINSKHNRLKPINFSYNTKFEKTQNLNPINLMNYCIMMWDSKTFLKSMKKQNSAILHGKIGYYNLDPHKSFIIKTKKDLNLVENLLKKNLQKKIKYFK
tara:strand:- start:26 stop:739 length:714 start_codon:yes stop_codon:yes gene_type:complete